MRLHAIHQFHSSATYGDGITKGMLFIQRMLREAGHTSNIYCAYIEDSMRDHAFPFHEYENRRDDLLLVHYSLGTGHDGWLDIVKSPRILVYHNLTPAHFFPERSEIRRLIEQGRRQLVQWARNHTFVGAIGDSKFNSLELYRMGYHSIVTIALLVDLDRIRAHPWNPLLANDIQGVCNLLFVGRISEHKGQLDLVRMMPHLCAAMDQPVRLLFAGATTSVEYEAEIRNEIDRLGLTERVRLLGRRADEDIYALYRHVDLYVSVSRHEGFGMPLLEAMAFDLPVVAFPTGSVAATLGSGGLIIESTSPEQVAAAASALLRNPWLRRRVIDGQRESLVRFERPVLAAAFEEYLGKLGYAITLDAVAGAAMDGRGQWVLEGPFDSSHGVALVNRELARGLCRAGETMALISRDDQKWSSLNESFMTANGDIAEMAARSMTALAPDVCLRNQIPPFMCGMRGALRVYAGFAWEESEIPLAWVREFNATLDLITVPSHFVAKILRDNGVHIPVCVTGHGADHIIGKHAPDRHSREPDGLFRFLHVSSGLPRKGIDALLTAWGLAFSGGDPVVLIIKVFPDANNQIELELERFRCAYPGSAPLIVINQDIAIDSMQDLYEAADVIVSPTRGEGFGLTKAEAFALGKAVVATAHGGHTDFCRPETAWLCDYAFSYARSQFNNSDSVWVEPDVASLSKVLRQVFDASPEERSARSGAGRDLMLSRYTWDQVAARTQAAIGSARRSASDMPRPPRIGLVSTWNVRCDIASYARSQVSGIERDRLVVFANKAIDHIQPDESNVRRCWTLNPSDPLDDLHQNIREANVDAVVVQFNFGFFHLPALGGLLDRLHTDGILVFVTLHATKDLVTPGLMASLADIQPALSRVRRLLVHSVHDLNRLKAFGLIDNVALFPSGISAAFTGDRMTIRASLGLRSGPIIASFGYLLPHKGLRELIEAVALLRARYPNIHLLMLNGLSAAPESEDIRLACHEDACRLGLRDNLTMITDYLSEQDVIAYPHQEARESASAAVKTGLASLKPVIVTPLDVFADVASVCHVFSGSKPADIAAGLENVLSGADSRSDLPERQKAWVAGHTWSIISARLDGLIRGEMCQPKPPSIEGSLFVPTRG